MYKTGRVKPYDSGDYALTSSRELLEEIRDKLYAQCGDLDPNVLKVDICGVGTVFQTKDCAGANVGSPQKALNVVTLNKQIMQICNVTEVATAIGAVIPGGGGSYNTPEYLIISPGNTLTIAASTVHSLSYKIIGGYGTLQVGTGAVIPIVEGESDGWEASSTLNRAFAFVATTGTIKIATIKA